jgi:hypothetical protein
MNAVVVVGKGADKQTFQNVTVLVKKGAVTLYNGGYTSHEDCKVYVNGRTYKGGAGLRENTLCMVQACILEPSSLSGSTLSAGRASGSRDPPFGSSTPSGDDDPVDWLAKKLEKKPKSKSYLEKLEKKPMSKSYLEKLGKTVKAIKDPYVRHVEHVLTPFGVVHHKTRACVLDTLTGEILVPSSGRHVVVSHPVVITHPAFF